MPGRCLCGHVENAAPRDTVGIIISAESAAFGDRHPQNGPVPYPIRHQARRSIERVMIITVIAAGTISVNSSRSRHIAPCGHFRSTLNKYGTHYRVGLPRQPIVVGKFKFHWNVRGIPRDKAVGINHIQRVQSSGEIRWLCERLMELNGTSSQQFSYLRCWKLLAALANDPGQAGHTDTFVKLP